jgi:Tfp pilus assembly protein PilO
MEDILAIILIFGGGTVIAISFSPIGKAIAERIRGRRPEQETDPEILAELDDLRAQLSEVHERLDFAERLLPQAPSKVVQGGDQ